MTHTLLLVEDNEMNRDMLSRRLERYGYNIIMAINGQEGIDITKDKMPDLILLDMSLPLISGIDVTKILKADQGTKNIPIIALTAHALEEDKQKAYAAGCDEYETKPVELPRLLEKIAKLLPVQ